MDSLDRMDFALHVEKQFGFRSNNVLTTVGALWALADGQLSGGPIESLPVPPTWFKSRVSSVNYQPLADNIGLAMVRRLLSSPGDTAVADR